MDNPPSSAGCTYLTGGMVMDKAVLMELSNQCARVQTRIAQSYDTPEDRELIYELMKLYYLLIQLLGIKT